VANRWLSNNSLILFKSGVSEQFEFIYYQLKGYEQKVSFFLACLLQAGPKDGLLVSFLK
jgi:hypothetical protein